MDQTSREPVLVVDDDPDFVALVSLLLARHGYETAGAGGVAEALRTGDLRPSLILLDWQLGEGDGMSILPSLQRRYPGVPIVLVTAHGSLELTRRALRAGMFDYLTKPVDEARLLMTAERARTHVKLTSRDAEWDSPAPDGYGGLIGESVEMRSVFQVIRSVAPSDANVLILGESGTGKELAARAIHERSLRASGPFVALNMSATPSELVESVLFGHEKGAFTGADKRRAGAVEEANGGTLFLDEIGEMPIDLQPKLLRLLQERTYRGVGAASDQVADVRIVSATNRDPLEAVRAGRFREDLYYRLHVVPLQLPPLRRRTGDVRLLAETFLERFASKHGVGFEGIDAGAHELLCSYEWPGNVRELEHLIERIVLMNRGPLVSPGLLPPEILGARDGEPPPTEAPVSVAPAPPQPATREEILPMREVERRAIERALELCGGRAAEAARRLGISPATMYRRIRDLRVSEKPTPAGDGRSDE